MLYKAREAVIELFNDYSSITSEDKYKAVHGKGRTLHLKISNTKQMLQRLLIALAQVKTGHT